MTTQITLNVGSALGRSVLAAAAAALIAFAWYSAKWGFANTIATRADVKEVAELGVSLAPTDPLARFANAGLLERTFDTEDVARSLLEFETAVSLSPFDQRLWLGLGRARERDGDRDGAEKAYRKALSLAPNYARIHWALGNLLIRQGRPDEGFAEIRLAAAADRAFAAPAVAAAWQAFDGGLEQIRSALGDSDETNAKLVEVLAAQKRYDEAIAVWNSIPQQTRREGHAETAKALSARFLEGAKFRHLVSVSADLNLGAEAAPRVGVVTNGGFEGEIRAREAGPFDWKIEEGSYPQISPTNGQRRGGSLSLFVRFIDPANLQRRSLSQLVAVEPSRRYRLSFFYRSELKTPAVFRWEVASGTGSTRIAATDPLAPSADWREASVEFATPADVDGVTLRLVRENCASPACTVSGVIWFDEFRLVPVE